MAMVLKRGESSKNSVAGFYPPGKREMVEGWREKFNRAGIRIRIILTILE